MSAGRRTIDRRRRVLYSAHADTGPSTAASRREQARLREARSPAATYGSRVHRRLRGRWFGLVPVRRRTLTAAVGTIAGLAIAMCVAHYIAVVWPSIANRGEIARPLRLDRPDSFGRWFVGILMMGSAGASFLIYQLRRHRLDDFRGHYRLWRLVLIVMIVASLNSVVSLVDWTGALLDAAIGKRVALAGADWVRIVVSLGAAVLVLRLIAEIHRCKPALLALLAAAGFMSLPEAAKWNVLDVETIERWALVTSAPLLAFTSLFLALGIYLRMLYREVRRFDESDRLKDRFEQIRLRVFQRSDSEDNDQEKTESRRRWWQRKERDEEDHADDDKQAVSARQRRREQRREEQRRQAEQEEQHRQAETERAHTERAETERAERKPSGQDETESKPKRRWFGLRAAKETPTDSEPVSDSSDPPTKQKKRRFSRRGDSAKSSEQDRESGKPDEEIESGKPKRKFGLGAFRRQKGDQAAEEQAEVAESKPSDQRPAQQSPGKQEDYVDPDSIDWNGLSKSERRRLRKQLKRQNRAA